MEAGILSKIEKICWWVGLQVWERERTPIMYVLSNWKNWGKLSEEHVWMYGRRSRNIFWPGNPRCLLVIQVERLSEWLDLSVWSPGERLESFYWRECEDGRKVWSLKSIRKIKYVLSQVHSCLQVCVCAAPPRLPLGWSSLSQSSERLPWPSHLRAQVSFCMSFYCTYHHLKLLCLFFNL